MPLVGFVAGADAPPRMRRVLDRPPDAADDVELSRVTCLAEGLGVGPESCRE